MLNEESSPRPIGVPNDVLRNSLIAAAADGWKERLIDLSRRNNLLFYKPVIRGTLELPIGAQLLSLLSDREAVPISELLAAGQEKTTAIRDIARKGLENLEEKGLSTLYMAVGRCTWRANDGGRPPVAPIFLFPVSLKLKGQDLLATEVHVTGDPEVNPVLIHIFNKELNVQVTAGAVLSLFAGPASVEADDESDDPAHEDGSMQKVFDFLNDIAKAVPDFKADQFAVLGNFSFQKLAMVKDLENHKAELIASDVVAAIAGDEGARRKLGSSQIDTDPHSLDAIPPDNEFAVVEADSSQQCAIAGICAGQSAVVHGPPGTGKSQTITNLIATLSAQGKKILFVAEKRAALEVVMNRLQAVGLDHLAIDLHGAEQTPKKVMERVARTLNAVREASRPSSQTIHEQFVDRRIRLNQHASSMHTPHAPTESTVFAMQAALLRLPSDVASPLRWRGADLMQITPKSAERITNLLREAAGFESLFNRTDTSPWTGVQLKDADSVQRAIDLAASLHYETIPDFQRNLTTVCRVAGSRQPTTRSEAAELIATLTKANSTLALYSSDVFAQPSELFAAISAAQVGGIHGLWIKLTSAHYRTARKRSVVLRHGVKAPTSLIHSELAIAKEVSEGWNRWTGSGTSPRVVTEVALCSQVHQGMTAKLRELEGICGASWSDLQLGEIFDKIAALATDNQTPYRIHKLCEIEAELYALGTQRLIGELRTSRRPASQWVQLFRYVWLTSTLDAAALANPDLRAFVGVTHDGYVNDFKQLDRSRLQVASDRVRRAHAERTIMAMNQFPGQEALIRSEAAKSRRHKPLRKIFAEAPEVLTAVCPCWMASPLSVSQLISATGAFDYVIFDEASQVLPEDAVPAILRGKHVIVAGDSKQLPPTTFFAAADDDDDDDPDATAYESLLDMMIPFVKGFHLNWHYRSRDESLIAFSNHHIYDDRLVTFPGPGGKIAMSHVQVSYIPGADGQEESSAEEVNEVVRQILAHAKSRPDQTLGVITMGVKHANRIQALLDRELTHHPELAEFFDTGKLERFFVKNLERVQGDERDVIILSVGYGKDRAGNLPLRFGPILSAGGRRRLNVATTRAKVQITAVSSFAYSDIDSTKVRPGTGLEFLKNYLQYAASGGKILSSGDLTNEPMNDFEADVAEALNAKGISVVPQVGCSRYRIDLAAVHPTEPGRYVLAIECDGATYHSSYTARDRDRLRQQQLENLGWRFHRIWSTDWFMRKHEEVQRAVEAFWKAVEAKDRPTTPKSPHQPSPDVEPNGNPKANGRAMPYPPIHTGQSITEYSDRELRSLVEWVQSDGRLRTNEEIADEMFSALPFSRRGARIEEALNRAIRSWERSKAPNSRPIGE
jgi:very-short-patch-repair endonuclease